MATEQLGAILHKQLLCRRWRKRTLNRQTMAISDSNNRRIIGIQQVVNDSIFINAHMRMKKHHGMISIRLQTVLPVAGIRPQRRQGTIEMELLLGADP